MNKVFSKKTDLGWAALLVTALLLAIGCGPDKTAEPKNEVPSLAETSTGIKSKGIELPQGLDSAKVAITELNFYTQNGYFIANGWANNNGMKWQQVFLKVEFQDAAGQPVKIGGEPQAYIPVASSIVPALGRSIFAWAFKLDEFSGTPAKCTVSAAGGKDMASGFPLVNENISSVKVSKRPANDSLAQAVYIGQTISFTVYNSHDVPVEKPYAQLVIYGKDEKIWYASVIPADSSNQLIYASRSGALAAKEHRVVSMGVFLKDLPIELQKAEIGNIVVIPFGLKQ